MVHSTIYILCVIINSVILMGKTYNEKIFVSQMLFNYILFYYYKVLDKYANPGVS